VASPTRSDDGRRALPPVVQSACRLGLGNLLPICLSQFAPDLSLAALGVACRSLAHRPQLVRTQRGVVPGPVRGPACATVRRCSGEHERGGRRPAPRDVLHSGVERVHRVEPRAPRLRRRPDRDRSSRVPAVPWGRHRPARDERAETSGGHDAGDSARGGIILGPPGGKRECGEKVAAGRAWAVRRRRRPRRAVPQHLWDGWIPR
jgi:hypothetical protein